MTEHGDGSSGPLVAILTCECGHILQMELSAPHAMVECSDCGRVAHGHYEHDGDPPTYRFTWTREASCHFSDREEENVDPEDVHVRGPLLESEPAPRVSARQHTDEQLGALSRIMGINVTERLDRLLATFGPSAIDAAEERILDNTMRDVRRFFAQYRTTRYLQDEKPADPMTPDELGDAFRG